MKIKELIFEKFVGTFSYFIVGKIEGYKNIRYYIYIFENKLEAVDMEFSLDDRMKMVFTNKMTF